MEKEKMRMRPNEWMVNEKFLSIIDYHNKYYIENLGKVFSKYIESLPIPVITTWDPNNKRIYVLVGNEKRFFEVDDNVSYFDFIYLVEQWLYQFFPKFEIEEEVDVGLDDDEIYEKVQKGMSLDDALLIKKKSIKINKGIITKIYITNDEFTFSKDGKEFIRITGSLNNLLPLSTFLKKLRELKSDVEIKDFIYSNSRELKQLSGDMSQILVDFHDKMIKNFFIIHYEELKDKPIIKITNLIYEWDKYKIVFETKEIEKDCLHYLRQKRLEEGINIDDY